MVLGVDVLEDCEPVVDCVSVPVLEDCEPVVDCAAATDATARSAASAAILNCVIKNLRTRVREPALRCAAPRGAGSGYVPLPE